MDLFQYGLDASWELDLFGRVRRSVEQARATTQAQQEAANDALLMLESEVAQAYVQLRSSQALLASQQENVRTAQDALDLTLKLQRTGLDTAVDVDQARTQLLSYQAQLPGYEKQTQQTIDNLNVLVGQPPGYLDVRLSAPASTAVLAGRGGCWRAIDPCAAAARHPASRGSTACGDGQRRRRRCRVLPGHLADGEPRHTGDRCELPDELGEPFLLRRAKRLRCRFSRVAASLRTCGSGPGAADFGGAELSRHRAERLA